MDKKIADDEQRISDDENKIVTLQNDNDALTRDKVDLNAKLAEATTRIKDLSQAPAIPTPAPAPAPAASSVAQQTASAPSTAPATATPPAPAPATPAAPKTSLAQMGLGVVVIRGDNAEGTGFLVKMADGPVIVTNLHVLANNPHFKITTPNGLEIPILGMKGAADRDLALLVIKDGPYTYLPIAVDVNKTAQVNDEVITPGNSQGGNVVLNTSGKLVATGPDRIEFNNPIYHGNSGGPVFHTASGTVIGVVTEAMQVDMSNDLDKTSFQSRNSAIASSMRYFGLRIDNVARWEAYDVRQYENETAFLDDFNEQSRRLDSFLNNSKGSGESGQASSDQDAKPYLSDDKIMAAANSFHEQLAGTDTAGQIDALRQLSFALDGIADKNVETIENANNFYSFDQDRARKALAYRKALKAEIQEFGSDVNRIGDLPRSN